MWDRARKLKQSITLSRPVISIGNLTWGGSGKTPTTLKAASDLRHLGFSPAVLTRGYGGFMGADSSDSDEADLLKAALVNIPIGVGPNREKSAADILTKQNVDVFLLDDGFQHWRLKRNVDIVCVDATDPWGGGFLVPAGRLREPLEGLSRASLILLTRTELLQAKDLEQITKRIHALAPSVPCLLTRFETTLMDAFSSQPWAADSLKDKTVLAVCGIGNPQAFEKTVKMFTPSVITKRFIDHYLYKQNDVNQILAQAQHKNAVVITTEKDWTKLKWLDWKKDTYKSPLLLLKIKLTFDAADQKIWQQTLSGTLANSHA